MDQPQNIGNYKIVRALGQGLMGPVYHASCDGQYWALRVLSDDVVRQTPSVSRLVGDEKHPALVRYKETGVDPQVGSFVSIDFMDARPISRDGLAGVRVDKRMAFLTGLLEGVAWLHGQGLVHGCIKPSNVLLRKRGREARGMFIDAGLVYVPGPALDARLLRRAYPFMAPELIEAFRTGDRKTIDAALTPAADIYAAGMLVAEVFSGRQLFADARSVEDLLKRKAAISVYLTGLTQVLDKVQFQSLSAIVNKAMAPNPGARLGSITELVNQLSDCVVKPDAQAG